MRVTFRPNIRFRYYFANVPNIELRISGAKVGRCVGHSVRRPRRARPRWPSTSLRETDTLVIQVAQVPRPGQAMLEMKGRRISERVHRPLSRQHTIRKSRRGTKLSREDDEKNVVNKNNNR